MKTTKQFKNYLPERDQHTKPILHNHPACRRKQPSALSAAPSSAVFEKYKMNGGQSFLKEPNDMLTLEITRSSMKR